ncbi:MAG: NAD+ synthase [Candidatus Omnitrophica bacterium]|nr:NAD+ synthase [Candidatus Omnitrophota bacterium]
MVYKKSLRLAMAQINCTVGDLEGNSGKIISSLKKAKSLGVDIISFPELAITGYPPEDLLLKAKFITDNLAELKKISRHVKDTTAIVGFVDRRASQIYNAAAVIYNGKIQGIYHKTFLPNYGVFDEKRYFSAGNKPLVFRFGGVIFGVSICEDIWHKQGPVKEQAALGAKLIININASPYYAGKIKKREEIIRRQARANRVFICHNNLVGGQDELVFDGQSMIVDSRGNIISRAAEFKEDILITDVEVPLSKARPSKNTVAITSSLPCKEKPALAKKEARAIEPIAEIYQALTLGLHDYIVKNGFKKVVIGLSGGIDSCLVATLAVDALGKDNVIGVFMPSQYSSVESGEDARGFAKNLGIKFLTVPIEGVFKAYLTTLEPEFSGLERNIAEENLQARIRGTLLMALSNKFGWIVLATGNKSEMSTGYATLYGDMAGGFAVIKDVPKILVYKLSHYRNFINFVIPERILTKAPTAELRPNQKDTDSLPPYETLDPILKAYIEEDKDLSKIVSGGFAKETAARVLGMVDKTEYKRRQSPPGIKITPKAFGRDRRMPITNKYKG